MNVKSLSRDFVPQFTRIGSQPSKARFTLSCSACGCEKTFDASRNFPDTVVAKKFSQWGWLIGRLRRDDLCPACVGVKMENRLAERFRVVHQWIFLARSPSQCRQWVAANVRMELLTSLHPNPVQR
jgi:hypothetical protein